MTHPVSVRQGAVKTLIARRNSQGHIADHEVDRLAAQLDVSSRTIRRWIAEHDDWSTPRQLVLDTEAVAGALAIAHGNVTEAHRILQAEGHAVPPLRTFHRRATKQMQQLQSYLHGGEKALRASQLYMRQEAPYRNHTWQVDHSELPVWIVPTGYRRPRKPYLTAFIDDRTRMCTGFGLDFGGRGGSDMIVAVLAKAVQVRSSVVNGPPVPGGDVGGAPEFFRHDLGADFTSDRVSQALVAFGIERSATNGYMPWQKGKIERFFETMQRSLIAELPGYTDGGKDAKALDVLAPPNSHYMNERDLLARVASWVDHYNYSRSHAALAGRAPFEVWMEECHAPLRTVPPDAIRTFMLEVPNTRRVHKDGIHQDNKQYISPNLPAVGTHVTIRHLPHDTSSLEVYEDDHWVCTAVQHHLLDEDGRRDLFARRRNEHRAVRQQVRDGVSHRVLHADRLPVAHAPNVPMHVTPDDELNGQEDPVARPRRTGTSPILALLTDDEAAE